MANTYGENENQLVINYPAAIFQNKFNVTASFAIGTLLFFLPFLNIKCNEMNLASATGVQVATGFKLAPGKEWKKMGEGLFNPGGKKKDDSSVSDSAKSMGNENEEKEIGPNYFMLASMIIGAMGAIISILPFTRRWLVCAVLGWIGIASFVLATLLILDKTHEFRVDIGIIKLSVNFSFWFFLSLFAFLIATVFSHKHREREWSRTKQKEIDEFIEASGYSQAPTHFSGKP